ncbi:MAG: phytoene desaturase [Phycisphaerales bacterium]|nr:phytoene desaturase [Hyphomonadaceae bacterium]
MSRDTAIVVGAGIGGLCAAVALARAGVQTCVLERGPSPGGKMRQVDVAGAHIDAGPTVLTMRWVFDDLFADAGSQLSDHVTLTGLPTLARHAWSDGAMLDLHADTARTADAIGALSGTADARGYLAFCAEAKRIYDTLRTPFLTSTKPDPITLSRRIGLSRAGDLFAIQPFETMWSALSRHFRDPRLRQLFGRYATYCGSSPFQAPATLMLIAHVEQQGVWSVEGGMHKLAGALEALAKSLGVSFHYNSDVERIEFAGGRASGVRLRGGARIEARDIVFNGDPNALKAGLLETSSAGAPALPPTTNSLSAITWCLKAQTHGFNLSRHNVFFSDDYRAEFDDLFRRGALPKAPTLYICAQDREGGDDAPNAERLLVLVNAPARGGAIAAAEIEACETATFAHLRRCGLEISATTTPARTTPADFERLFPATGGALYGRATHGWAAAFQRPGARTRSPGLYLAGGGAHPGAGVPMAALSGRLAAESLLADRASTRRFQPAGIRGGTSTLLATTKHKA